MAGESLIIGNGNWGVKSGNLLGYNLNNAKYVPRELAFTRATTGTRTNGALLVEEVPYNLVQYSEQFDNGVWSKSASSVNANITTAPDGTLTADKLVEDTTNASHSLVQTFSNLTTSLSYTLSVYLKASERFRFRVRLSGYSGANDAAINLNTQSVIGGGTLTNVGNGWFRFSYTINTGTGGTAPLTAITLQDDSGNSTYLGNGTSGAFIWGAQLVAGSSPLDYLPTTTRLNIPRIDYSTGTAALLMEPQRTNLALQSSSFSDAYYSKSNLSVNANTSTSPSGVIDADTLVENTLSGGHFIFRPGFPLGTNTASVYAKANTRNFIYVALFDGTSDFGAYFNLSNGTIGNIDSGVTATITNAGDGWYRCAITFTSAVGVTFSMGIAQSNGVRSYTGNGTGSIDLWGAQLEVGAYATSYIPTTSASVTRNADTLSLNNIFTNGFITSIGGTWFLNLKNNIPIIRDGIESGIYIDSSSAGFTNGFNIRNAAAAARVSISKWIAGAGTPLYTTTADNVKIAIKWNGTTADIFQNGVKVVSATSFAITNMEFLQALGNVSARKYIASSILFPTPLTDAECLLITS